MVRGAEVEEGECELRQEVWGGFGVVKCSGYSLVVLAVLMVVAWRPGA